ncbi:MAG TPA: Fe-S cluster assembly protein SufD [Acidimicrobiales bacterium]|nr:Fe-S cluster assembly protein SufD [Acidimicrobiales bacterium]
MAAFSNVALPSESEEVWRYSRISQLDLDAYQPLPSGAAVDGRVPSELQAVVDAAGDYAALAVVRNGRLAHLDIRDPRVQVGPGDDDPVPGESDAFTTLNREHAAEAIVVRTGKGVAVEAPVLVLHWVDAPDAAVFPRLVVRADEASQLTVLDHIASPLDAHAFVAPVVQLEVGDAANLRYLNVQELGPSVWQIAYQASQVGRDATLNSSLVALGGDYARVRADSRLAGQGGSSNLLAVYFGDGAQMHDFRTMQDHDAPKTTSDLLFKGAVEDQAHSVYSGLIRVRKGAAGTNAFQTNRNLVLTEGAHADSVPNLEIEENDVRCSHASAVGPIDEEQRYYLEARGVPTDVAERLIILGFFNEVIERTPIAGLRPRLRDAVAAKLGQP